MENTNKFGSHAVNGDRNGDAKGIKPFTPASRKTNDAHSPKSRPSSSSSSSGKSSKSKRISDPSDAASASRSPTSLSRRKTQIDAHNRARRPSATQERHRGSVSPIVDHDTRSRSRSPSVKAEAADKPVNKQLARQVTRLNDVADATEEACSTFQVIPDCLYGSKNMGATENDALDCDCTEQWHKGTNMACDEDSDCINRATKIECSASSGNCRDGCQNQRFRRKQYAKVSVIKTEKKGFGLRADQNLEPNDFIWEYVGEVINEAAFRRRMVQYDKEGIKHFYFMSLTKSEFVDATQKGNLGRFCNHSCKPNCYVDKWVVGDKLRMGIFALREILDGEELVFNYNVDRYGADPQPCYCGEANCVGFIGGKTQTGRATKLPVDMVEALGIDDGEDWSAVKTKKPRKKKADEDDEEYINSIQPRELAKDDVSKVLANLRQCKEKWITVKLLERIQRCEDPAVMHEVMKIHGYQILKTVLNTFFDDNNVVLQALQILYKFPRVTRNKIQDSKIEDTVELLAQREEHEEVAHESKRLLEEWSKLQMGFRIKRRDPNATKTEANTFEEERRNRQTQRDSSAKKEEPVINAPKGPRSQVPQRNPNAGQMGSRMRPRAPNNAPRGPLPEGWFQTTDDRGNSYFYDKMGNTTWKRPTRPGAETPHLNLAGQARMRTSRLQNIITEVTGEMKKAATPQSASQTPQKDEVPQESPEQDKPDVKWRSMPEEKKKKIFTVTIHPVIKKVMDKYHGKFSREDYKQYFKEASIGLVEGEFKQKRIEDPSYLSSEQVRRYQHKAKVFLDKAVVKSKKKRRDGEKAANASQGDTNTATAAPLTGEQRQESQPDEDVVMSDAESVSSSGRKRKRDEEECFDRGAREPSDTPSAKRLKEVGMPPPPPPPPEASSYEEVDNGGENGGEAIEQPTEEELQLREQEEALVRENEEAERMEAAERDMTAKGAMGVEEERHLLNGEHPPHGGVIVSGDGTGGDGAAR